MELRRFSLPSRYITLTHSFNTFYCVQILWDCQKKHRQTNHYNAIYISGICWVFAIRVGWVVNRIRDGVYLWLLRVSMLRCVSFWLTSYHKTHFGLPLDKMTVETPPIQTNTQHDPPILQISFKMDVLLSTFPSHSSSAEIRDDREYNIACATLPNKNKSWKAEFTYCFCCNLP